MIEVRRSVRIFVFFINLIFIFSLLTPISGEPVLQAGFAKRDITPPSGIPMWGYGARHDLPAEGTKIPLYCKVIVFDDGTHRAVIAGLDLGRSPTQKSMDRLSETLRREFNISTLMLVGSHTHHGPVIELIDEPECGQGKFNRAIKYVEDFENNIIETVKEAVSRMVPIKIGWASESTDLNRNRVSKKPQKVRDPELTVVRIDCLDGKPMVGIVNFSAHPVLDDIFDRRWSADWPGIMQQKFEELTSVPCIFLQGSAGDMSPNTNEERKGMIGFGNYMGQVSATMFKQIQTSIPTTPKIQYKMERYTYPSRMDITNPLVLATYKMGFFPELINALMKEFSNNTISVTMTIVLLNKELALVGGSGEFFSGLALRLKEKSPAKKTLFLGYCNGHSLYIPTIEAVEEGGYGADPMFAWVPVGTGEQLIDTACNWISSLMIE